MRIVLNWGVLVVVLATLTACQPGAQPTTNSLPQLPPPQQAKPKEQVQARSVTPAQTAFPSTPVPQVEPAPVAPPWTPVTTVEPFNDRSYPALREWTASTGGFHTAAKFNGLVEGQVQLRKGAGGEVVVPLNKLSAKDRQYVKELIRVEPTANVVIGKVFRVIDNHSIAVMDDDGHHLVHLEGIDPLDVEQQLGLDAKDALAAKIHEKHVWIEWREKDRHEFMLGQVFLDGRNINLEMVAEGHARHDRLPRLNPRMANAELIARRKRLGVWNDDYAESPFGFGTAR